MHYQVSEGMWAPRHSFQIHTVLRKSWIRQAQKEVTFLQVRKSKICRVRADHHEEETQRLRPSLLSPILADIRFHQIKGLLDFWSEELKMTLSDWCRAWELPSPVSWISMFDRSHPIGQQMPHLNLSRMDPKYPGSATTRAHLKPQQKMRKERDKMKPEFCEWGGEGGLKRGDGNRRKEKRYMIYRYKLPIINVVCLFVLTGD